jgi:hypothetical protein
VAYAMPECSSYFVEACMRIATIVEFRRKFKMLTWKRRIR